MYPEKLTRKTIEAINGARESATEAKNAAVEPAHILLALLSDGEGLVREIAASLGADADGLDRDVKAIISSYPSVSGSGYSPDRIYFSVESEALLSSAEAQMEKMGDEYLSTEHLMLGLFETKNSKIKEALSRAW